jgi:hypothetical protein
MPRESKVLANNGCLAIEHVGLSALSGHGSQRACFEGQASKAMFTPTDSGNEPGAKGKAGVLRPSVLASLALSRRPGDSQIR